VSGALDVAVIGGGVMGLSTAFHLLERDPGLQVAVVERDPT
jgi:L-2-hydroxyglutarate oxidase LhgO